MKKFTGVELALDKDTLFKVGNNLMCLDENGTVTIYETPKDFKFEPSEVDETLLKPIIVLNSTIQSRMSPVGLPV